MEFSEIPKTFLRSGKMFPMGANFGHTRTTGEHKACQTLQYWKVYFDFAYFLLLLPFRFKFNEQEGVWEMKKTRIQQVLRFINNGLIGLFYIFKLRKIINQADDPSSYFDISFLICDTIYLQIIFYVFGRRGHDMLALFNEVQVSYSLWSPSQGCTKGKLIAWLLCSLSLACTICSTLEICLDAKWNLSDAYKIVDMEAHNIFSDILPLSEESGLPYLTLLGFWSTMYERILNAFSDILFTMTALWFYNLVRSFLVAAADVAIEPDVVIASYTRIKYLVELANEILALMIGSFVLGNLPFYVTNVFDVFSDKNVFLRLRYLFYCSYYFPSLFLAAKSCRKMEVMKSWSCQPHNVQHLPLLDATLLVNNVSSQPIALDCFGWFHVNFSLVGSLISVIMTYALVKSQFQTPAKVTRLDWLPPTFISS